MVELETINLLVQVVGVSATAIAAVLGVSSYINSNKRAQETRNRELETRQAQMFMNIYNQAATSEFQAAWLRIISTTFTSYEEFNKSSWFDEQYRDAINNVSFYFEGVGVLVKEGILGVRWVALMQIGGMLRMFWEKVKPWVEDGRKLWVLPDGRVEAYPRWLSETEYLYGELMKYVGENPELRT